MKTEIESVPSQDGEKKRWATPAVTAVEVAEVVEAGAPGVVDSGIFS